MPTLPRALQNQTLSHPGLEKHKARDGTVQFATLGRGNHFLEFQADQDGQLWLMLHSGSRAMGQNIRAHHTRDAQHDETTGLAYLDARTPQGQAYLQDVQWALTYAHESRNTMLHNVCNMLAQRFEIHAIPETRINCHHNEVRQETIQTQTLWVHRKGAMRAQDGQPGIIPGSMGATSFHVLGRGNPKALLSSSHGAGRCMSRTQARKTFSTKQLTQQMKGIWFNHRIAHKLRDEAPNAYKNIHAVMRAQQQLTKITRSLNPILSYKGT